MGIRAIIQKNPSISTASAAVAVLASLIGIRIGQRSDPATGTIKLAFYTDDGGASYFADSIDRIPPYQRNGKQAVRAEVIKGATGSPFVAYLIRYSPRAKAGVEAALSKNGGDPDLAAITERDGMEVEKPLGGDAGWVPALSQAAAAITDIHRPAGVSEPLCPLVPER